MNPSEDFVRLFVGRVYDGRITETVKDQFNAIVRGAFHEFVSDRVRKRLKSALQGTSDDSEEQIDIDDDLIDSDDAGIVTTEDEMEGFYIVKSIVRQSVDPNRVYMRDTQSYCGVLLDDNNRKPICRLFFNSSKKYVGIFDPDKKVTRHAIDNVNDIYRFADSFLATVSRYDAANSDEGSSEQ